ncbi:MAG: sulfatase [Planctomycetes bacterium]|nr:sulfatase [Planctomycetota bacterium]
MRRFASTFVLLIAAACSRGPERMNVLLVTLDTTRADYLSCYGAPAGLTPNLDALAAEGARFDLAISTAAVTPVSHASILTGLENMEHGLRVMSAGSGFRLGDATPTLATVLKQAGWSTAAVHSAFPVSSHFGFQRGFDLFESLEGAMKSAPKGDVWDVPSLQRRSDETSTRVLDALAHAEAPWFCWIHYWDPHDDALVPPDDALVSGLPRGPDGRPLAGRELYANELHYVDAQFGRVVADLKARGAWEKTIVMVVADHGEGLGDHGWEHHRILYQEQIRVPLLVRVPGLAPRTVKELVRTTDLFPTVLDYLGLAAPKRVSGRTLRPLLEGRPDAARTAYADQINGYDRNAGLVRNRPRDAFLYGVIQDGWKLVWRPEFPDASELYDLSTDPREEHDRLREAPERVRALGTALAQRNGWVVAPFPVLAHADPGANDGLGTLGYVASEGSDLGESDWGWTCPVHRGPAEPERRACSVCGAPPLLARRAR